MVLLRGVAVLEERFEGRDVEFLAFGGRVEPLAGLLEELLGPLGVVDIRHGHAPVGHGAIRIDLGRLAERSLRFEVIERVELCHALVDERLRLGLLGRGREVEFAHSGHDVGMMPRPVIEGLAVYRMAWRRGRPGSPRRPVRSALAAHRHEAEGTRRRSLRRREMPRSETRPCDMGNSPVGYSTGTCLIRLRPIERDQPTRDRI